MCKFTNGFLFIGEVVYSNKKSMSNSTLGRSGRSRHRAGGITSSSSATSCNSNDNRIQTGNGEIAYHDNQQGLCLNNGNCVNSKFKTNKNLMTIYSYITFLLI